MKHLIAVVALAGLCTSVAAVELGERESAASAAATSWLSLVDAGTYGESWKEAAPLFRSAVTSEQWDQSLKAVRAPLGSVRSRKLESARLATELPGVPDGEYVVLEYSTSFEHKQSATETVTPMRVPDGTWRVSGYYIR